MKIILTHEESEKLFHSALCNALDYISAYGIGIQGTSIDKENYQEARKSLEDGKTTVCYEDVLMQILKIGKPLNFFDSDEEKTIPVTLSMVHDRVQLTQLDHLIDAINETGDAITDDVIIQTVLFKEIVYG